MDKKRVVPVNQLPATLKKQSRVIVGDSPTSKDLLRESAREFDKLLQTMKHSGLPMEKIHRFNSKVAGIGDACDLSPEEMLFALTLLARYIILHSNLSHGERVNKNVPLLLNLRSVIDRLVTEEKEIGDA